jgi:hypothetical protein
MFHVKHRAPDAASALRMNVSRETSVPRGPKNAILQNNPMHQKIVLLFQ